ncbi:hypothetical protein CgunFtcFv8_011043 [Champsocephalus gunnari]|uniref:Uncharacterized protein n=1 Tax=Champsocephalus gunnari TaxID=52237 RepID=A0AAN8DX88_CHAGU|nr:hypothetical protein CgunFtcFv8_011043 [Champsocephalus gunnari]
MVDLSLLGGLQKAGRACTPPPKTRAGGSPLSPPPFPVNVPNHHPFYRNPPQHSQPKYFEDSRLSSSHSSFPTLPSGAPPDNNGDKKAAGEFIGSSYMQTTLVMHGLAVTPPSHNPVPVTSQVVKDQAANMASAAREEDEVRSEEPELNVKPSSDEEETTTTTITTTTIVTTMQSPVPCQMNLTGPDGYIKAPPQSSSAFQSTMDCSYVITVYMGYGVEVQVRERLNINPFSISRTYDAHQQA